MGVKLKLPCRVALPYEFARFMREVVAAIDKGDMCAWTESDDLLQCTRGYGGLYDQAEGRYGFEYLADDDEKRRSQGEREICWYFDLDRSQIRDIATGKVNEIDLWRCEPDCGRRFPRSNYPCDVCDFLD